MKKSKSQSLKPAFAVAAAVLLAALCFGLRPARTVSAGQSGPALASGGASSCAIVIPDAASEVEKYAAAEAQSFLEKISGARLEIAAEKDAAGRCALLIGETRRGAAIVPDSELAPLGMDGFILRARGADAAIRGGGQRGTLYGVYGLLEDHLGVRWLAKDTTIIPRRDRIDLSGLEDSQKPAMEYREPFFNEAFDPDWAARNRSNGMSFHLDERHGGGTSYVGGFVHTAAALVPPDKYFKDHPEYFSMIAGERIPNGQLCLTNPDVLRIVRERVLELAESTQGKPSIISVSQNDNFATCSCPRCVAADREEGGPTGTLINFVNKIADAVAEKYPNVAIDTLAYQYTENVPRHAKPRPNVIIRLCHMAPSCDIHPLQKCYLNNNYVKNLKSWSRISNRVYTWHYVTNFAHYLGMLPDLNAIKADIPFYYKNSVKGFFAQGSYQSDGGEMAELKAWIIAKMLWNPNADFEALLKEFVDGYYGPAAPAMTDFINAQREHVKSKTIHANLYTAPDMGYLDVPLMETLGAALDRADKLAAGDPLYSEHIRKARLWYDYTRLAAPKLFTVNGKQASPKQQQALFNHFKSEVAHFNVTVMREGETLDNSLKKLRLKQLGWQD
ncbi:MAG: DUF4838 domain-containing protein [bacterium]